MLDLVHLQTFVEVAERGTIADAAIALSYTGPAVSQQIAKLERDLGQLLFDRIAGRLRLNARGEHLLVHARTLLDLAKQTEQSIADVEESRHVVVAGFASALRALVVRLLDSPLAATMTVEIREAEDDVALRELGLGHVDLAIVQEYDGLATTRNSRFTYTTLLRDRLRLVAPAGNAQSVKIADLAADGWLTNGDGTRCELATAAILNAAGIDPLVTGRISDNQTLLALVAAGHGATIVPELVLVDAPKGLTIATQDLRVKRTILGATRGSAPKQHAQLLRELRSIAKELIHQ